MAEDNPFGPPPSAPKRDGGNAGAPKVDPSKLDALKLTEFNPGTSRPTPPKPDPTKLYVPDPKAGSATMASTASDATPLFIPALGRLYAIFAPITEPLIRLMAGGSLAFHGYQILFGNIEGAARFFESLEFQNGLLWAWVVGSLEFVCGLCLALGFFTRLAAGPILVFLVVAIATYHIEYGFNWEERGIEYPLFWAIVVFHFLIRGGGKWSLDRLMGREI